MKSAVLTDRRSRPVRLWLSVLGWMGIIFLLSAQSGPPVALVFPQADKVGHFILYLVLGILLVRAWRATPGRSDRARLLALVVGIIYAASDEFHQRYVPGRTPDWADFGTDTLGLLAAMIIMRSRAGRRGR